LPVVELYKVHAPVGQSQREQRDSDCEAVAHRASPVTYTKVVADAVQTLRVMMPGKLCSKDMNFDYRET
jgi:hypothetical protein